MSQEKLDEAVARFEARFPLGEPTVIYKSVTGEPYVTLGIGGIKREGDPHVLAVAGDVVELFSKALDAYASDKAGVLYWRRKPVFEEADGKCKVTARLLISDMPALPEEQIKDMREMTC